jgi:ATP-dependent RNA helicase DeaD
VLRFFESPGALVFCNTREAVRHLQAALLERGFSVVALSGELKQNERTQALQALRDGRSRVCVATDVAARGIDLPNLDLVIHAELPNDAEVMQHRSGRTGRAGRKGVSVLLVPPQGNRRAELLLNESGIDALWGTAPQADEIRRLDHERMLQDAMFTEETASDDLILARALLAERSPEDIAAALARLYRARLPSPEDILDPGPDSSGRPRDDRSRENVPPRGDDRTAGLRSKTGKSPSRHGMAEGSVWFRAAIGRKKNAEARWLLPMICRRGGIDKNDIGAIRILDTTTEFEISERVAESFAARIRHPDKEDNIRVEPLADSGQAPSEKRSDLPWREAGDTGHRARRSGNSRDVTGSKQPGKPRGGSGSKFGREPGSGHKKKNRNTSGRAGQPRRAKAAPAKAALGRKARKNRRG